MLPVDYIVFYRDVCTMGGDGSCGTSVFHWFVLCDKSQILILSGCILGDIILTILAVDSTTLVMLPIL